MIALGLPILGSLLAEPLTGLVDTAFVARLGAEPLAALGVGTMVLSAIFWALSFLGVATQTLVAGLMATSVRHHGGNGAASRMCFVAVLVALVAGTAIAAVGVPFAVQVAGAMGASGVVQDLSVDYLRWRLAGAPAMLVAFAALGALRGVHDMVTPLRVAVGLNALNLILDPILIFGWGVVPAMGVVGAALASTASQWAGALWAVWAAFSRLGRPDGFDWNHAKSLLSAGTNLVARAVSLNVFLLLGTRKATLIGASAGAVHQVVRSVWFFDALFLDSFAILAQSLVAHFLGRSELSNARRVARVALRWSFGCGVALAVIMLLAAPVVRRIWIPAEAVGLFASPWTIAALSQPISGITFGSDGVHFGSGDFRFLRNVVLTALVAGGALVIWADPARPWALDAVWWAFAVWTSIRAAAGVLRIWPGSRTAPLGAVGEPRGVGRP